MFCRNCGKEIPEGAKFCGACGTPVREVRPEGEMADSTAAMTETQKGLSRRNLIILGVVVVVAIVVIVLCVSLAGGGYKRPIRNVIRGYEDYDAEKIVDNIAPFVLDAGAQTGYTRSEIISEAQEDFDDMREAVDWMAEDVEDFEFTYSIGAVRDCSSYEIIEMRESWMDDLNKSDIPQIKKMKLVNLDATMKGRDEGEMVEETDTMVGLYVAKIGRKWYIVDAD